LTHAFCATEVLVPASRARTTLATAADAIGAAYDLLLDGHDEASIIEQIQERVRQSGARSPSRTVAALEPHVAIIRGLRLALDAAAARRDTCLSALDRLPYAIFILSSDRRIVFRNARARERVATESSLGGTPRGLLAARKTSQVAAWRAPARVVGLPGAPHLVVVVARRDSVQLSERVVSALFDLTPAEARVVTRLASGRNVTEIANELGVSRNAVRFHVKNALAKTHTRRQPELVRLVLRSPAALT
jgi:DNA-binding CsgD family transcriptional regulator